MVRGLDADQATLDSILTELLARTGVIRMGVKRLAARLPEPLARPTARILTRLQLLADRRASYIAQVGALAMGSNTYEWMLRHGGVEPTADLALGTVDSWVLWNLTGGPLYYPWLQDKTPHDFFLGDYAALKRDYLPPDYRATVVLCDVVGLRYEEIAYSLGVAMGTVKSRLTRARQALRLELREARTA